MSKVVSAAELRKMPAADLRKEIVEKRASVSKMKVAVEMRSHKDTAQFRRERKELARMLTVLNQVESSDNSTKTPLKAERKASTVRASKKTASSSN